MEDEGYNDLTMLATVFISILQDIGLRGQHVISREVRFAVLESWGGVGERKGFLYCSNIAPCQYSKIRVGPNTNCKTYPN